MARPDPIALSVATLSLTSGIGAFYQFLPPLTEVRKKSATDTDFAADVHVAEIAAASVTLAIGGIASSLSESILPVLIAAAVSLGLICLYEYVLRSGEHYA